MIKELITPDYIFEASWEVCNKVGGIYTVLSTRANTLQAAMKDKLFFIGPDFPERKDSPLFIEDEKLYTQWRKQAAKEGVQVRVGRWNIPGTPIVFLVNYQSYYAQKNEIYTAMWNLYGVDSLHAYGDYDESSMFAYAAGRVVESFYRHHLTATDKVIFQAHEWMTGIALLYLQARVPEIATIFTTHATSIGRSIAGNNKPLYDYLFAYNGDQMAEELNMQSKHSIEKQTAHHADCFTTVSEITDNECKELLDKPADVILMNGFENNFVPPANAFTGKRKRAKATLLNVANRLLGTELKEDTLIVGISGRYEFKNKGIDVFLEALARVNNDFRLMAQNKRILAFIDVPGWEYGAREDLVSRLKSKDKSNTPLDMPYLTHRLHNMDDDKIVNTLNALKLNNLPDNRVKVIFVPCYLDGNDGIFNRSYYDLLIGQDLSIYPSYYEPWGYTPLESAAFHVPTITTDLAGFGRWVQGLHTANEINDGVTVLHRSDYNYSEVADGIKEWLLTYMQKEKIVQSATRRSAAKVAEKALWKHFIKYYYEAYDRAFQQATLRNAQTTKE
jgi:glycosyltransferase involved in cell wall biosynthesis